MENGGEKAANNLLVFGQGPVIDKNTRNQAEKAGAEPGNETVNLWGENLGRSAAILYHNGDTNKIIAVGGKTGGPAYQSEAEITRTQLVNQGVPESQVAVETSSTNTLENLVNFCNEVLDAEDTATDRKIDIMGAPYHITRMKVLMKLFAIPYNNVFSSDEMLRYTARQGENIDHATLNDIERRLDFNAAERQPLSNVEEEMDQQNKVGYYTTKEGTEQKTIVRRTEEEEVWDRALLEIPEYSLPYFSRIKDDKRLGTILHTIEEIFPGVLAQKDIHVGKDEYATIRGKLAGIERKMPDVETWIAEHRAHGLPQKTVDTMQQLLNK